MSRIVKAGLAAVVVCLLTAVRTVGGADSPIVFNANFEGGSLGKIEVRGENQFRCLVQGQYDEHGRNRQANWYYFRMEGVKDRDITLTLADLVGEYNGKPGACPMNPETIPVFSDDNQEWRHFPEMSWDDARKEATLRFRPRSDRIWIAHVPPTLTAGSCGCSIRLMNTRSRVEAIGKTARGRDLHMVTVTDFERPGRDQGKKVVWLQARQHAWEAATSHVMEGALRFITSDDPLARSLRGQVVFVFTPMMDPDGCALGGVRFNANGYDVNRHWDEVDVRRKDFLRKMPEIWYVKKAVFAFVDAGGTIDLMLNLHNTETAEYVETPVQEASERVVMNRFFEALSSTTSFDPSAKLRFAAADDHTTNSLYRQRKIPVALMEQRIGVNRKLNRRLTDRDRLDFGRELIRVMAQTVLGRNP